MSLRWVSQSPVGPDLDRKSTRLNSSHTVNSYAVFCVKKKKALQEENRVYHLAALWDLESEIRWCDNDRLAIRDITAVECPFCGRKTRVRPLTDVLVDLAAARGARLDFMLGENESTDILRDEFGGIAGLTRF